MSKGKHKKKKKDKSHKNKKMHTGSGLCVRDESINHADVTINDDGLIVLETGADVPKQHGSNHGVEGWKAIASLCDYKKAELDTFSLSFTWEGSAPVTRVYANVLVKADVINGEPVDGKPKGPLILVTDISNGGGVDYTITFDPNNFMIVGYRKGDTGGWYGQSFSLDDLSAKGKSKHNNHDHDDDDHDHGHKSKKVKVREVYLILGDSTTQLEMDATVTEIDISPPK